MEIDDGVGFASVLRAGDDLIAHVAEVMHKALDAADENWHLSCMDPDGDGSCAKGHYARRMLAEDVAPKVIEAVNQMLLILDLSRHRKATPNDRPARRGSAQPRDEPA